MGKVPLRIIALCLPGVLLTAGLWTLPNHGDDFRAFYRAANLVHTAAGVYSNPGNTPHDFLPFLRLPSYACMLRPLALVGYRNARIVWTVILVLAFGLFLWLNRERRDETAMAIFYSVPVAYSLILGQDLALVLLIAIAAVRLHAAKREVAAGFIASLLAIKLTYLFPVALVFLARSRRGAWGLATGMAIQLALSFVLEGPRWPLAYLALLRSPLLDPVPRQMVSVRALVAALPYGSLIFAAVSALIIGWLWFSARRLRFGDAIKVALALGLIASPHCYAYDAVVLIPLFVSTASPHTRTGKLAAFGLTPIPYFMAGGTNPAAPFIGAALIVSGVLFSSFELYRTGKKGTAAVARTPIKSEDCPAMLI